MQAAASTAMGNKRKGRQPSVKTCGTDGLPPGFLGLMSEQYGAETASGLCHALMHSEPETSIRINRRKLDIELPLDRVPWCSDAYYLAARPTFTFDPLLHAGAYYVQEASSMYVAEMVCRYAESGGKRPLAALDLCAAPGGKSTLLAGLLHEGSTLISNEAIPKRAHILSENMQKWTRMPHGDYPVRNVVSNNNPADFHAFTGTIDLLLADVPCSGEGMFRKDRQAVKEWSVEAVATCQARQRGIVEDAWHVLRPGGLLIYSTCTFNRYEDEDNARWICQTLGGELLEERHFLPGRDRGEGFYAAAIRKHEAHGPASGVASLDAAISTLNVMPKAFDIMEGTPRVELSYQDAVGYLRREAVRVEAPAGMVLLCHRGLILGPGKCVGNRINNLYPTEWRIRSGHAAPFCITDLLAGS